MNRSSPFFLAPVAELHRRQLLADEERARLLAQARRPRPARRPLAAVVAALRHRRSETSRGPAASRPAAVPRSG